MVLGYEKEGWWGCSSCFTTRENQFTWLRWPCVKSHQELQRLHRSWWTWWNRQETNTSANQNCTQNQSRRQSESWRIWLDGCTNGFANRKNSTRADQFPFTSWNSLSCEEGRCSQSFELRPSCNYDQNYKEFTWKRYFQQNKKVKARFRPSRWSISWFKPEKDKGQKHRVTCKFIKPEYDARYEQKSED